MSASVIRRGLELFSEKGKLISASLLPKSLAETRERSDLLQLHAAELADSRSVSEGIVQQHSGRRACHRPDPPASKPEEESVFTEKDFQKFQKE
uniref:Active regulator of SIRT1 n=1 Tax=Sinocyclocheilus grahami TaxID=75366 RepID=A0A672K540_SINGR